MRNHHAIAELSPVLQKMEVGRVYTNQELYDIAKQDHIQVGFSTVGRWLDGRVEDGSIQKVSRGLWMRLPDVEPPVVAPQQGRLALEPSEDPAIRTLQLLERIEGMVADIAKRLVA